MDTRHGVAPRNRYRFERTGHAYLRSVGPGKKVCECGEQVAGSAAWTLHLTRVQRTPVDSPDAIRSESREIKNDIRDRRKLGLEPSKDLGIRIRRLTGAGD